MGSLAAELELGDTRVEFIADYVLKTLKIKPDKFLKMYGQEENKIVFGEFLDKAESICLVVVAGSTGMTVSNEWPSQLRQKACYFVKRKREALTKESPLRFSLIYGDLSYSPIDQLSAFVDEVSLTSCTVIRIFYF